MKRIALALLFSSCATSRDYLTGESTLNRFTIDEEIAFGQKEAAIFLTSAQALGERVDPEGLFTDTVRSVAFRLLSVPENRARTPPFPFVAHHLADPGENAVSFPGGPLVVLSGLLRKGFVRNEDELALLVAHEIGHISARHSTESATFQSLADLGAFGRFVGHGLLLLVAPDARHVKDQLEKSRQAFSHEQELEADLIGLELMTRAGFDPARAVEVWRRKTEQGGPETPTHPAAATRVEELEAHLDASRFVASRMISKPPPKPPSPWEWPADSPKTSRTATTAGPLPFGPEVPSLYVRPEPELLAIRTSVRTEADGSAPRAIVVLEAAPAIADDHLPFTAILFTEDPTTGTVEETYRLAVDAQIEHRRTTMRIALPTGAAPIRLRARAVVGALWAESAADYVRPEGAPWVLDPAHARRSADSRSPGRGGKFDR